MKSKMYSEFNRDYDKVIQDNAYNAHYERPSLQALLPELKDKNVLDIGCGSGIYAEYLIEHGASVTAVDASTEMIELFKERLAEKATAYVHDLNLPLVNEADESYDLIIAPLMIHYIKDINRLFKDLSRVLKTGGEFIFSTHHPAVDFQSSPSGDYFQCELITEEWDTVGRPVEVSFYRRPLSDFFAALSAVGFAVLELSEGKPTEQLREESPEAYERIATKPNFIFVKAKKL